jgi:hypothetical protein
MPTELERYRFDLDGYIVVPDALDPTQVQTLNDLIDHQGIELRANSDGGQDSGVVPLELDPVFRDAMVNPRITPYLDDWLGPGVRLDHCYFVFAESGRTGLHMHLGGTPYVRPASYHVRNGRIFSALTVVSYVLAPSAPGEGFACVRGSHKSEFPLPTDVRDLADRSFITVPEAKPGDAIIFTEALTHGSTPWTSSHMRRALLYKYCPGHMIWVRTRWSPAVLDACTDEQRAYLEPPYIFEEPQFDRQPDLSEELIQLQHSRRRIGAG